MFSHWATKASLLLFISTGTSSVDSSDSWESIIVKPPAFLSRTTSKPAPISISRKSISFSSSNKSSSSTLHLQPLFASTSPSNHIIDWENHQLCQNYKKAGGILYKQSILTPWEFQIISSELSDLLQNQDQNNSRNKNSRKSSSSNKSAPKIILENEDSSSFATNRIGAAIGKGTEIYRVLSSEEGSLSKLINVLEGTEMVGREDEETEFSQTGKKKMVLAPEIPIEVRIYEKNGAAMEWHVDDVIYHPTQIEVVLTIDNTSDCQTMWKPHDRLLSDSPPDATTKIEASIESFKTTISSPSTTKRYKIESTQTTPNSAIILRAGGVEHKVSPLSSGKRTILKMAFVREDANLDSTMVGHVTHHHHRQCSSGAMAKKNTSRMVLKERKKKK
mmetsp:Transcript_24380/g.51432  ORF Transcript_24380/g.51432 Transcript_24380/m.51432 type:complete len:390 (-) Transcript_24380:13-1182(-)